MSVDLVWFHCLICIVRILTEVNLWGHWNVCQTKYGLVFQHNVAEEKPTGRDKRWTVQYFGCCIDAFDHEGNGEDPHQQQNEGKVPDNWPRFIKTTGSSQRQTAERRVYSGQRDCEQWNPEN